MYICDGYDVDDIGHVESIDSFVEEYYKIMLDNLEEM